MRWGIIILSILFNLLFDDIGCLKTSEKLASLVVIHFEKTTATESRCNREVCKA